MNSTSRYQTASRLLTPCLGLLLLGLATGGCHKRAQPSEAETTAKLAAQAEDQYKKETAESSDEATNQLPPDYPTDLALYPGAKVDHVRKPKGSMREIYLTVPAAGASLDQLISFYKAQLAKGKYEITSSLRMVARKTWSCDFHKGGQQASVMTFPNDKDKSLVTIDLIYQMPAVAGLTPAIAAEKFDIVGPGDLAQQAQTTTPVRGVKRN